jgi:hypothetical protein
MGNPCTGVSNADMISGSMMRMSVDQNSLHYHSLKSNWPSPTNRVLSHSQQPPVAGISNNQKSYNL